MRVLSIWIQRRLFTDTDKLTKIRDSLMKIGKVSEEDINPSEQRP